MAIHQIAARPRAYIGKLVSVDGRVTEVVRGEAFVLEDTLLVLAAAARTGAIKADQRPSVLGGVRRLDPDQLPERANIDERLFGELAARPAIVAQAGERP